MARTLPWLKDGATTLNQIPKPRQSKRPRTLDGDSDPDNAACPSAVAEKKRHATLRAERTPSTSPPPAPPTEELMRPGLDADDIYVMVEDEFLSVARTFTAHLHHAEYLRLKNAAKKRNASTISTISRPVDSITAMRAETRRKKEAEKRESKAKEAVEGLMAPAGTRKALDDSESEFDEGEKPDDPWQGTQLQRFMAKSPRKQLAGLTGLQGVVSHTRAAAGFERAEKRAGNHTPSKPQESKMVAEDADTSDEDTDDLDAPNYTRASSRTPLPVSMPAPTTSRKAAEPIPRESRKAKPPSPPRPPPRRAFLDVTPISKPAQPARIISKAQPASASEPPIKQEALEDVGAVRERLEARRKAKFRRERAETERTKSGDGVRMGVDEIPVFLF